MFFGYEVKFNQGKATPLTLELDTKLSQAVLDPAGKVGKKDPVSLVAEVEGKSYILAVLDPTKSWQCPLDIVFAAGSQVKFYIRGQGTVHLTGYEERDDLGDDVDFNISSEESSDEEMAAAKPVANNKPQTSNQSKNIPVKTKAAKSPVTNGVKLEGKTSAKSPLGKPSPGKPSPSTALADSDSGSSDDDDFDVDDIEDDDDLEGDDSDDDEDLSFGEMSTSDDDMDDMDDKDESGESSGSDDD